MSANCKIPTPKKYVEIMLNSIGYERNIFGKKVLENSCGSGNILLEVSERYIKDAIEHKVPLVSIVNGLEKDIWAYDTDKNLLKECKFRLDELAIKYDMKEIKWNLINDDVLKYNCCKFDYIISNPPYITYHDLNDKQRKQLRENFQSCKSGRFDYYYAFLEHALNNIEPNGKMIFLVPNNILKNVHGNIIRNLMKKYVNAILDFTNEEIFDKVTVSSIMIACDFGKKMKTILVKNMDNFNELVVEKDCLRDKWVFHNNKFDKKSKRFGDYFKVSNSVATLKNEIFILNKGDVNINFENELLVKAVSPRTLKSKREKMAIFPYKRENDVITRFDEAEIETKFPYIYKYLKSNKDILNCRSVDNTVKWFEYGRHQAVNSIVQEKLIIPMVFSENVNVYFSKKTELPYAGYYITKIGEYSLEIAKNILTSYDFKEYIKNYGTKTNKTTYRLSCKDIENYMF